MYLIPNIANLSPSFRNFEERKIYGISWNKEQMDSCFHRNDDLKNA